MAMTYTTLVGTKTDAGSIMNWSNYTKLDAATVLDEAQSLLYSVLRVREMRTEWVFGMVVGQSEIPLPARFLDPIGKLYDITNSYPYDHRIETDIQAYRSYDTSLGGTLGANPFTTASGLTTVTVHSVAHTLTQGSTFTAAGATATGGLTLNGTWPVTSITDADNFVIDTVDTAATSTATGGGSAVTFTANQLISGSPSIWTIFDEKVKFDVAFETAAQFKQLYYRAPTLLSSTNTSNWLTNRYPKLMRVACLAAAAEYMKDTEEYQKQIQALNALAHSVAVENDMGYRGMEFGTDTP
jgi:hypothetical protein